jgi:TetR/AcrR family transcriptional regulator, cholesterol catabolism regulator
MKEKILSKAKELFFKFGLRSVSMDDICRELGVSKKTIYLHFETKDKLIEDGMKLHKEEEIAVMKEIRTNAHNAIDELLCLSAHVAEMLTEVTPTLIYDCQKYYREIWTQFETLNNEYIYNDIHSNLKRGVAEGLYRDDFDIDVIAKLYLSLSSSLTNMDVFPSQKYSTKTVFQTFMMYHLRGIATPKGMEVLHHLLEKQQEL